MHIFQISCRLPSITRSLSLSHPLLHVVIARQNALTLLHIPSLLLSLTCSSPAGFCSSSPLQKPVYSCSAFAALSSRSPPLNSSSESVLEYPHRCPAAFPEGTSGSCRGWSCTASAPNFAWTASPPRLGPNPGSPNSSRTRARGSFTSARACIASKYTPPARIQSHAASGTAGPSGGSPCPIPHQFPSSDRVLTLAAASASSWCSPRHRASASAGMAGFPGIRFPAAASRWAQLSDGLSRPKSLAGSETTSGRP